MCQSQHSIFLVSTHHFSNAKTPWFQQQTHKTEAGCMIERQGASAFCDALAANTTVSSLDLRCKHNHGTQNQHILTQAKEHTDNELQVEGARFFGSALESNKALTSLSLRGNKIKNSGVMALSSGLAANTCLTTLDLGCEQKQCNKQAL